MAAGIVKEAEMRWRQIPGAVADLTLGTMIVLYQLAVQARSEPSGEPGVPRRIRGTDPGTTTAVSRSVRA